MFPCVSETHFYLSESHVGVQVFIFVRTNLSEKNKK